MCYSKDSQSGFTIVEIAIVVPMVIIIIGLIISFLSMLTSDAIKSKGRDSATYSMQSAIDDIEQNIRVSNSALTRTSGVSSPQGVSSGFNGSGDFVNTGSGAYLILKQNATTSNSFRNDRTPVYFADRPSPCNSSLEQNDYLQITVVYFVDSGVLKRRTIVPSYTTSLGNTNSVCAEPWQKNTCKVVTFAANCKKKDDELLSNVSSFNLQYFSQPGDTVPISDLSKISTSSSILASIATSQVAAGETINTTSSVRATKLNPTTDEPQAPTSPDITFSMETPSRVKFSWKSSPNASFYDFQYKINSGAWQSALSNSSATSFTVEAGHGESVTGQVVAKNISGNAPAVSTMTTIPLWANVPLRNNWSAYWLPSYPIGVTKASNGEVFLKGLVSKSAGLSSGEVIATLPEGYRPNQNMIISTLGGDNEVGRLDVLTNGNIVYIQGPSVWISLDNIRFIPSNACSWSSLTPGANWTNYTLAGGPLQLCVDSTNRVHYSGALKPISGTPPAYDLMSNFPFTNARSGYNRNYPAATGSGSSAVQITKQDASLKSNLQFRRGISDFVSPTGAYYSSQYSGSFSNLTLINSWVNYDTSQWAPAQYTKANGIVTLQGVIKNGSVGKETVIATLPVGYRPKSEEIITQFLYYDGLVGRMDIRANGNIVINSANVNNGWISLDNITFIAEQ